MNSYTKLAIAMGALLVGSAGAVWYQRSSKTGTAKQSVDKTAGTTPADTKAVHELTELREQRKQLSKVSQPDDTHQIYKHYQRIVGLKAGFQSQPELYEVQIHVVPMAKVDTNDLIITPMDCLVELGYLQPAPEGSDPIFHVIHFTDENDSFMDVDPLLVLEIDGDAFAMWKRDAETFLTSGPAYTNYSTMGYLEALLDTMLT